MIKTKNKREICSYHFCSMEILAGVIRQEKILKDISLERKKVKLSLLRDDMILCVENLEESTHA